MANNILDDLYNSLVNKAKEKYKDINEAKLIANQSFKKLVNKIDTITGSSLDIMPKKAIIQSMLSSTPIYAGEVEIDFHNRDLMGFVPSSKILEKATNPYFFDKTISIEHSDYEDIEHPLNVSYSLGQEPYKINKIDVKNNKINLKFTLNPEFPKFNELIKFHEQGELMYISPEFKNVTTFGNLIVDTDKIGWSVTSTPKQINNKIKLSKYN